MSFISFESQIFQTLDPSLLNENEGELLRIEGQVNLPHKNLTKQRLYTIDKLGYKKHNNGNKFLKTIKQKTTEDKTVTNNNYIE